jgi:hypothetical protein
MFGTGDGITTGGAAIGSITLALSGNAERDSERGRALELSFI